MKTRHSLLLGLLALSSVCARANIFGADRRVFEPAGAFSAVGRVHHQTGPRQMTCTGTLIHERFVLTAAHCVARRDALSLEREVTTFFDLADGAFQTYATRVWSGGWMTELSPRDGDWAIVELARAVPAEVARPLPLVSHPLEIDLPVTLPGFSLDRARGKALSVDRGCHIRLITRASVFHHDCGAYAGASGGPILVKTSDGYAVAGVHNAHKSQGTSGLAVTEYSRELANLGASVEAFGPTVKKILSLDYRVNFTPGS